ncbi:MAG: serine protease [Desulfamplus sp.]|nr:serine protease [Desulfamplus sp.]
MKKHYGFFVIFYLIICFFLPSTSFSHQTRIVGGTSVTDPQKYPWIAAIVDSMEEDINYGQFCGGTLIAPGWVVTAAHCACEDNSNIAIAASDIDVVLGTVSLKANPTTYERIEVTRVIVHPSYDPYYTDNDVALLKLKEPSNQQPIEFLDAEGVNGSSSTSPTCTAYQNPTIATTMGWGQTEAQQRIYPSQLQEVELPLISNDECAPFFSVGEITENMLCAGFLEGGKDACFGDSGGPLVTTCQDGGYELIGVVSWGYGCAQPYSYGVYTRVSKVRDWIFEEVKAASAPIILRNSTPATVYAGSDITVYGSAGVNYLTIQKGARAKLINFPGVNLITIGGSSSLFRIARSGATVTIKDDTNSTTVIMPATKEAQLITFDNITKTLKIESNRVLFGGQEVLLNYFQPIL